MSHQLGPRWTDAALIGTATITSFLPALGIPLTPAFSTEFGVSLHAAQWAATISLLAGALMTPILGRLGDGPRARNALLGGMLAVLLGCVISAVASNFGELLVGRALQGVGYGSVPLTVAIARERLVGRRRQRTIASLSVAYATGLGLAYLVTGLLTAELGFRVAFWFGAAVSLLAISSIVLAVPPQRATAAPRVPLDVRGAALLGVALLLLLIAISEAPNWGWTSLPVLGMGAASVVVGSVWAIGELRIPHPLVDLRLLRVRPILAMNVGALLLAVGMFGALSLMSNLIQTPPATGYGLGGSALTTGYVFAPMSAAVFLSQPISRRLLGRYGISTIFSSAAVLVAVASLLLAVRHEELWELGFATGLFGLGIGATFALMPPVIVASSPPERTGSATSMNQVLRGVGGATGSAIAATILAANTAPGAAFPSEDGYVVGMAVMALLGLVAAICAFVVMRLGTEIAPGASSKIC